MLWSEHVHLHLRWTMPSPFVAHTEAHGTPTPFDDSHSDHTACHACAIPVQHLRLYTAYSACVMSRHAASACHKLWMMPRGHMDSHSFTNKERSIACDASTIPYSTSRTQRHWVGTSTKDMAWEPTSRTRYRTVLRWGGVVLN